MNLDHINNDFIGLGNRGGMDTTVNDTLPPFSSGYGNNGVSKCRRARGSEHMDLYGGTRKSRSRSRSRSRAPRKKSRARSASVSKKKRAPTIYQQYMKNAMSVVKSRYPNKYTPQQLVDYCASLWRKEPNKSSSHMTVKVDAGCLGRATSKMKNKKANGPEINEEGFDSY